MRLVITRFRNPESNWFVAEKDETTSPLVDQPLPATGSDLLTMWPTRQQACSYAAVVSRLMADNPDRPLREVRERAREIVRHG